MAAYLSYRLEGFSEKKMHEIRQSIRSMYGMVAFGENDQSKIIELLKFDKKNEGAKINFVLLREIGEPVIDRQVPNELIYESFRYYLEPQ